MARRFASATAFKSSLEAHLRKRSEERAVPFSTLQLKFVMERLLARLFHDPDPPWLLKGGFAMDLRFRPKARTTKDVDLAISERDGALVATIRDRLQEAAERELGDYLTFRIGEPTQELTNAPQGGARFPCTAIVGGKVYARFHIDVGCGDAIVGKPELLTGDDILEFAGIGPSIALAISKAQQFAEKIHAFTFPWAGRINTRTKDLVDLILLIDRGNLEPEKLREALEATFRVRSTHPLPKKLPTPPKEWESEFSGMADEANISTAHYLEAFAVLDRFWVLHGFGDMSSPVVLD